MKREIIEDMAEDYVRRLYEENEYPICAEDIEIDVRTAFEDGARWRVNSVWHKPSAYGNELTNGLDVIVKTHKGYRFGIFNAVGYYNEHIGFVSASGIEYPLSDVLEYAYLTDLLPEGKED